MERDEGREGGFPNILYEFLKLLIKIKRALESHTLSVRLMK